MRLLTYLFGSGANSLRLGTCPAYLRPRGSNPMMTILKVVEYCFRRSQTLIMSDETNTAFSSKVICTMSTCLGPRPTSTQTHTQRTARAELLQRPPYQQRQFVNRWCLSRPLLSLYGCLVARLHCPIGAADCWQSVLQRQGSFTEQLQSSPDTQRPTAPKRLLQHCKQSKLRRLSQDT